MVEPVQEGFALSPAQKRLWQCFASQAPGCRFALALEGEVNPDRLKAAVSSLLAEHEILRTEFVLPENLLIPMQVIGEPACLWLPPVTVPSAEEAASRMDELLDSGPGPGQDQPLKLRLVSCGEGSHVLLAGMHAMAADAATPEYFLTRLALAYSGEKDGGDQEDFLQYADYAGWQNDLAKSRAREQTASPFLELMEAHPGRVGFPLAQSPTGPDMAVVASRLDNRLHDALQRSSHGPRTSLLAAWTACLATRTGLDRLPIWVFFERREYEELAGTLGLIGQHLPLAPKTDSSRTFAALVRDLALSLEEAGEFQQDFFWEELSGKGPPVFGFEYLACGIHNAGTWCGSLLDLRQSCEPFQARLVCHEDAGGLRLSLHYHPGSIESDHAGWLLDGLNAILERGLANPAEPLRGLALLGAAEHRTLIAEFNQHEPSQPDVGGCIHRLFESGSAKHPDRSGVYFEGRILSYAAVNAQANQIAHALRGLGVGRGSRVAICMDRGERMVPALLGVMKAGGCYLPLDPRLPPARLDAMLGDSGAGWAITHGGPRPWALAEDPRASVTTLDLAGNALGFSPQFNPPCQLAERDPAYVIYTSGSTGKPKGVLIEHRSPLVLLSGLERLVYGSPADRPLRLSMNAPLEFDASVQQIVMLTRGHFLHILPEDVRLDARSFLSYLALHALDALDCTPTHLATLVGEGFLSQPRGRSLKVLVAGSAIEPNLWRDLAHAEGIEFFNIYGPTECTVDAAAAPIRPQTGPHLGRPLRHYRIYLLNPGPAPVPVGIPGQICIGGPGLAQGYLGRPELTAAKFVPDPFAHQSGSRLYLSGDLARFGRGQRLEFMGRMDFQVKIRGYRIELGEIERTLAGHPGVRQALVTARADRDTGADKRILAYFVSEGNQSPGFDELKIHLEKTLPDYMHPKAFVHLERFPLKPNGKIDIEALPEPESPAGKRQYRPPRTETECKLAEIWADMLKVETVGLADNFFELGGDSILSIQIATRARRAGLSLTSKQLFVHQTLEALAGVVAPMDKPVGARARATGPVPLTPIQRDFFSRGLARPDYFNQSLLLAPLRALDASVLEEALDRLVRHHEALMLRFRFDGSSWIADHGDGREARPPLFSVFDLSGETDPGTEMERLATEVQAGLDIGEGPTVRGALFQLGGQGGQRLFLTVHHLLVDGVSWGILLEDLESLYLAIAEGKGAVELPVTASWQDWAGRLAAHAHDAVTLNELDFWTGTARLNSLALPAKTTRAPASHRNLRTHTARLSAARTERLLKDVPTAYNTRINDVLLTALCLALEKVTGGRSLRLDLEGHGREDLFDGLDLSRTVGWFTTVFPVVLELESTDPGQALIAIKERLRALPRNGIGYGLLRYIGRPDAFEAEPQPELIFNYLGRFGEQLASSRYFRFSPEPVGPMQAPENPMGYLLDIVALAGENGLEIHWRYSSSVLESETVERIADAYLHCLEGLISHCLAAGTGTRTPSDFPLAGLGQEKLDSLLKKYPLLEDIYPLTAMQHGMLFHSMLEPESRMYVQQCTIGLSGPLDFPTFKRAWQKVVDRHALLRTIFVLDEDSVLQVGLARHELELSHIDLCDDPHADKTLARLLAEDLDRGFRWTEAPSFRLSLIRTAEARYRFVISFHHVILDGWSLPILLEEAAAIYRGLEGGSPPELSAPRSFREYVAWVRRQDLKKAKAYWREALHGFNEPNQIPTDNLARVETRYHGNLERRMTAEATAELVAFSRNRGLTINNLAQAVWAFLVAGYSDRDEAVFGVIVSGRVPEIEDVDRMVGPFLNTIPLRVPLPPSLTLEAWLRQVRDLQLAGLEYETTSLVEVQAQSPVAGRPLFESILVFENYPMDKSLMRGWIDLRIESVEIYEKVEYPIVLQVMPTDELILKLKFDPRRFGDGTIERMMGHLFRLFTTFARSPELPLNRFTLLTESERRLALRTWNDTRTPFDAKCMHRFFEERVCRAPDSIALATHGQNITYESLNGQANRMAHGLISRGVRPGDRLGICCHRGTDMVTGTMAVLKAGGVYVPMEPSFPDDRIAYILEHTDARLLLTQSGIARRLGSLPASVLALDATDFSGFPRTNPAASVSPDHLAYIIFTSGSTGRPKGVILQHRPVANLIDWVNRTYEVGSRDRLLFITSLCFDLSVYDIFGILAAGGCVCIAANRDVGDPEILARLIETWSVTFWDSAPAALQQLTGFMPGPGRGSHALRLAFLSGDWVPLALPPTLRNTYPNIAVIALGGATEATIWSNFFRVGAVRPEWKSIPYGMPIQNAVYLILNRFLHPCPVGVPGDLFIGDHCLSVGYHNRPDLTARQYIPDPFAPQPGLVLYRTGDRARRMSDGNIEFLGRLDAQVKVRGFRIELGEIESVLLEHSAVANVVVSTWQGQHREKRLVAYPILTGEARHAGFDPRGLREFLAAKLPDYMIPATFIAIDRVPVTANGKLDRKSLPNPDDYLGSAADLDLPATATEKSLAAIWCRYLDRETVGLKHSFFELGGHSLIATQVVLQIRKELGIELPLRALFENPTLAALAAVVEEWLARGRGPARPPLVHVDRGHPIPVSLSQQRLCFMEALNPGMAFLNVPLVFRIRGRIEPNSLAEAMSALVERHEVLRTRFSANGGEFHQIVEPPWKVELVEEDFSEERLGPSKLAAVLDEENGRGFSLEIAPLWRLRLFRTRNGDHLLSLIMHHLIVDGWSTEILMRELAACYTANLEGRKPDLARLEYQYADFAQWQHGYLSGAVRNRLVAFWKKQLAGSPILSTLPPDGERPERQSFRGSGISLRFDADLAKGLAGIGAEHKTTLFVTLLASLFATLHAHTQSGDMVIGTDVNNRGLAEVGDLVGFFTNQLVFRMQFRGNPTFGEFLDAVRQTTLDAFAHQELPFDMLVSELEIPRSNAHAPVCQIKLVYQTLSASRIRFGSAGIEPIELKRTTTQSDMVLYMAEISEGLACTLEYSLDLYGEARMKRFLGCLELVWRLICRDAEVRLARITEAIREETDRQRLLDRQRQMEDDRKRLTKRKPRRIVSI